MTATNADVHPFPGGEKRAPKAQPVTKLSAFELVRRLICEGQLKTIGLNVVQYLTEISDKATGWAIVEYATIGERIGRSRTTAIRSIQRLIDADVIERLSHRNGERCYASGYRLVDPLDHMGANAAPVSDRKGANSGSFRFTPAPGSVHQCTASRAFSENLSPDCLAPYRGGGVETSPQTVREWDDAAEWLARHGKYARYGPGPGQAWSLAKDDLDRWRGRCGDVAVIAALDRAKGRNNGSGWFGIYLIERLEELLGNGRPEQR
jgi:predicted transcriptional regulator